MFLTKKPILFENKGLLERNCLIMVQCYSAEKKPCIILNSAEKKSGVVMECNAIFRPNENVLYWMLEEWVGKI